MTGKFFQNVIPLTQAAPELVPTAMEMLKFAVTAFKAGKQLEGQIDETANKLSEMAKQPRQPQPNPELLKIQAQSQARQAEIQMQAQIEQQKLQMEMEAEANKQEMQARENQYRNQLEHERAMADKTADLELEKAKVQAEKEKELALAYVNNATKLETARIQAGLTDGTAAYAETMAIAKNLQDSVAYPNMGTHPLAPAIDNMANHNQQMTQLLATLMQQLSETHNAPKRVVRDENGKVLGVETVRVNNGI
jgi:uncharacterized membrane protein YqiK